MAAQRCILFPIGIFDSVLARPRCRGYIVGGEEVNRLLSLDATSPILSHSPLNRLVKSQACRRMVFPQIQRFIWTPSFTRTFSQAQTWSCPRLKCAHQYRHVDRGVLSGSDGDGRLTMTKERGPVYQSNKNRERKHTWPKKLDPRCIV